MTTDSETDPHGTSPQVHVYSPEELAMIDTLSARSRDLMLEVAQEIAKRCVGEDCYPVIESGTRTDSEQLGHWAKGRKLIAADRWKASSWTIVDPALVVTRAFPGLTAHRGVNGGPTGGDAVDISLRDARTRGWLRGGGKPDPRWERIHGAVATQLGTVWGGRDGGFLLSDGRRFFDGAHHQHPLWRRPGAR